MKVELYMCIGIKCCSLGKHQQTQNHKFLHKHRYRHRYKITHICTHLHIYVQIQYGTDTNYIQITTSMLQYTDVCTYNVNPLQAQGNR